MTELYTCLVCGWKGLETKPVFPFSSYEICACCGTEYGFDVFENDDIQKVRLEWLAEGAPWFDDEDDVTPSKPNDWGMEIAKEQIRNNLENAKR